MTSQFVSCPDCHSLVLDTAEERREHRAADRQDRQVTEAVRRLVRTAADDAASALQLVRDLQRDLEGLDGRLRTTEDAPEPDLVVVGTWPEDELDDPDDDQPSQYADDENAQTERDDVQADDDEDLEPDDEPDTTNIRAIRSHVDDYFTRPGGVA